MLNIQQLLNSSNYDSVRSILEIAGSLGEKKEMEVYVVGGFVRDLLMGSPINDIDLMTVGEGIPFAEMLANVGLDAGSITNAIKKKLKDCKIQSEAI